MFGYTDFLDGAVMSELQCLSKEFKVIRDMDGPPTKKGVGEGKKRLAGYGQARWPLSKRFLFFLNIFHYASHSLRIYHLLFFLKE